MDLKEGPITLFACFYTVKLPKMLSLENCRIELAGILQKYTIHCVSDWSMAVVLKLF